MYFNGYLFPVQLQHTTIKSTREIESLASGKLLLYLYVEKERDRERDRDREEGKKQ